jgi:Zn-dependent membrane protease YugP
MMFDPLYIALVIPAMLLALYAQMKVKTTFARYSAVRSSRGLGADSVSRMLLDGFGLQSVRVERVGGNLTDHYDPRSKTLRLSDSVGGSSSIAAIGVAAHEVGHAVQDRDGYAPLRLRNALVPIATIGSNSAYMFFFLGLILRLSALVNLGILLFTCAVVFQVVTLPVEFDASNRALRVLSGTGALTPAELSGAKSVLSAAALTYVAATVMAAAQLLYFLVRSRGRRN